MIKTLTKILPVALAGLSMLWHSAAFADAEVTRNSDGSWLARVDGVSVYQGSRYFDAVNAAANNMGAGTINIRNSGDSGSDGGSVYSRNSGRGFFSVSGSHGTKVNYVDIDTTWSQGIFLEDASNTHVLGGSVSNGNPNCQLVRTDSSSINVSGCDPVGTTPGGGSSNNGTVNGTYCC